MITDGDGVPVLDWAACDRARLARDRRYDGLFFSAVKTTRIYCRPICPVRPAHSKNVVFFRTAAEAFTRGLPFFIQAISLSAPNQLTVTVVSNPAVTIDGAMGLVIIEDSADSVDLPMQTTAIAIPIIIDTMLPL